MKIRLMGTEEEIAATLDRLVTAVDIQEISDFYPNRGNSLLGRVYVEVAAPTGPPGTVRAIAERLDGRRLAGRAR